MKITRIETILSKGKYVKSAEWKAIQNQIYTSILEIEHPKGAGEFIIFPESGKGRGKGNGVKPIKKSITLKLSSLGWKLEEPLDLATRKKPGKLDAVFYGNLGTVAFEWETGNISSSHRALNKMALGLLKEKLVAGVLTVPSRNLYRYLTDRIGNFTELEPYLDLWRSIPIKNGVLQIMVIEHDKEDNTVPRIPKGTDGRALI